MDNLMTRVEYFYSPKDKVEFYRAARKDMRQAQKRAGVARLPAKLAACALHYNANRLVREDRENYNVRCAQEIRSAYYAANNQRHESRQYFDIISRWEWNSLHLWIPKEVQ